MTESQGVSEIQRALLTYRLQRHCYRTKEVYVLKQSLKTLQPCIKLGFFAALSLRCWRAQIKVAKARDSHVIGRHGCILIESSWEMKPILKFLLRERKVRWSVQTSMTSPSLLSYSTSQHCLHPNFIAYQSVPPR